MRPNTDITLITISNTNKNLLQWAHFTQEIVVYT